ncbi:hypothetical protein A3J90_03795 [candidate division WOR-1 bacterium RIFOXYC2_FULL_37_10]|uniref:Polymerase beta nucleotidyltransferase domain-containing protein n=1 Tax=candidate division WOR-1 bacterium RIFOXYB2_FULL_37_13 TaxID=1802579 RepID=A0A1F4SWM8_UNCSA|nr:MAG: hypothetical protein A2246_06405 [candidate division WOR-1 bacterium RIFOXYA2_FULL_37_7]OGC24832.1 MAG: hypothetical protein A2310_03735 [candidate division WOR-1 bacterium RIFOXYB2_FULL_37_13]OGC33780.1 MAG: hypothetical protein A3J90_03795 [candidate division WOR-1 bacterium RIFOXYC2_FULL_37_10]
MANKKTKLKKNIKSFLEEFSKIGTINQAILFGSYAKGTSQKWSDIDLAIISKVFENKNKFQRLVMLGKLAWKSKTTEIEALGFTPKEYKENNELDILSEIKRTGKVIYSKN